MKFAKFFALIALVAVSGIAVLAQANGTISGEVNDPLGAAIIGATVKVSDGNGVGKTSKTNNNGRFRVNGLAPGKYTITVEAPSFAPFERPEFEVKAGNQNLRVVLRVADIAEEVDVSNEGQVSTDSDNNASAVVLKEDELESLPDDPDDLEAALQALAGGGAGPSGGQIFIDGFEGGQLPPKEAIREIRINRDPFSAEFDRMGFGRIEILTKPGSLKFSGQAYFNFKDDAFNARNPFSINKADSQEKSYGGYVSSPIVKNKASFSVGVRMRDDKEGESVNATILDSNFGIVPFQQELSQPQKRYRINPRFDYQINDKNTLVARYDYGLRTSDNFGSGFTLPSRGTSRESNSHTIQLTETAILNAKTVNETRFQYRFSDSEVTGDNSQPAVNVLGAFNGGGATTGLSFDKNKFWELQNYTTTALGKDSNHGIKFGVKIRGRTLEDRTDSNYNGSFTFTGFVPAAPSVYDLDGNGIISSIEQYRAKVLGETDPAFNPSQFSITTGEPFSSISQYDVGLFVKDDWKVNKKLTLNIGLRYENQTNIDDALNFAPRFGFAFSPGADGARAPKTVFRGGFGIFFTRFSENLTLQARRLADGGQQQFVLGGDDPLLSQAVFGLNGVTNAPTADQLINVAPLSSTPRIIASDVHAPYTMQSIFSVERQLPRRTTVAVYYSFARSLHMVRSRNINAPVCPTGSLCPVNDPLAIQALRPDPLQGNIYQYETSGVTEDQRLFVRLQSFFSRNIMAFAGYFLGSSKSNADSGFLAYSYDDTGEFTRSRRDARHFMFMMGSFRVPYGFSLRPFVIARSGTPFNITAGQDLNGDSIFNDRPTFAQLEDACNRNGITESWCDVSGNDPNAIVPRNFGRGPGSLNVNLSIDKTFGWGNSASSDRSDPNIGRGGRRGGRRGGMFGGRGGRGGFGGRDRKPYEFTLGVRFRNLLNTNNLNNPVGNINSPLFGQSTNIQGGFRGGGPRTVEFRTRFRW